ncbi:hypothetical protein EMPS_10667 [Entomortierella parvispora]|uniref:HAT C-terminal dimerisation domain-containing protein n=1 Tax=Entomortierella parvispora TaxID=205924 RepID=A0A9P3M1H6_9FUNG|nr:hypothetical protein EMPS_10667 [Entomortierella parvispora]
MEKTFWREYGSQLLSNEEFDVLKELLTVLRPTAELTVAMSSNDPVITGLYPKIRKVLSSDPLLTIPIMERFQEKFVRQLAGLFSTADMADEVLIATYLHPTNIKNDGFFTGLEGERLKQLAEDLILATADPESPLRTGIDFGDKSTEDLTTLLSMELQSYIELAQSEPLKDYNKPHEWWAVHGGMFKYLSQFVVIFFSIQASSAASERLFSVSGCVLTAKRTRLGILKLKALVLLATWDTGYKIKLDDYYNDGDDDIDIFQNLDSNIG